MMKRTLLALSAATLLLSCSPSRSADMPIDPYKAQARVQAPWDWSGFIIGAHGGHAWGTGSGAVGPLSYGPNPEGWLYGVHAGAQKQFGVLVLGVQADISKGTGLSGSSDVTGAIGTTAAYDIAYLGTAEVKVGLAMGQWLPHLTAGGACARGNGTVTFGATTAVSSDSTACGWTIGGGLDWALAPNFIVTAKYQFLDLGTQQVSFPIGAGVGLSAPLDLTSHVVKVGASLKF